MTNYHYQGNIFSGFSSNSEAFTSELLKNLEKRFFCIGCIVIFSSVSKLQLHNSVWPVAKGLINYGTQRICFELIQNDFFMKAVDESVDGIVSKLKWWLKQLWDFFKKEN